MQTHICLCLALSKFRVVSRSSRSGNRSGDGQFKPTSNCGQRDYDDTDDIVFEVLPSPTPQDTCRFETLVTLDDNLSCQGRECLVSTVRVVEVVPGKILFEYNNHLLKVLPSSSDSEMIYYCFVLSSLSPNHP